MFRRSLLSIVIGFSLGAFASVARAQPAPTNNQPPAAPAYSQPALAYGVYDFTGVFAQDAGALAEDRRASMELLMTVYRLQREYHDSPDYKTAAADLEQAHDTLDSARKPVLASVAGDPHYQDTLSKYQNVSTLMSEGGLTPRDLADMAKSKMQYGSELRRMEAAGLNADSAVQSARQRVVTAQQKIDDLNETFEATLYKNPQWASAKKSYDHAEIARVAADGAAYGALVTAWYARGADIRHSIFGLNPYANYTNLAFIDPGSYYGRRY